MKKIILIVPVLIALMLLVSKAARLSPTEKSIDKSISLSIYRENNYSSAAYDSTIASVHITVSKVADNKCIAIYDKTLGSMQLSHFPEVQNALNSSFTISNILDNKEKLLITYDVTYNTRGSELTVSNYLYTNAAKKDDLKINI